MTNSVPNNINNLTTAPNLFKTYQENQGPLTQEVTTLTPIMENDEGKTLLHRAVFEGDQLLISRLLTDGAYINCEDKKGKPPLYYANSADVFNLLVSKGADWNHPKILRKLRKLSYGNTNGPLIVKYITLILRSKSFKNPTNKKAFLENLSCYISIADLNTEIGNEILQKDLLFYPFTENDSKKTFFFAHYLIGYYMNERCLSTNKTKNTQWFITKHQEKKLDLTKENQDGYSPFFYALLLNTAEDLEPYIKQNLYLEMNGKKIYPDIENDPNHLRLYIASFQKASGKIKALLYYKIALIVSESTLQDKERALLKTDLRPHLDNQTLMEIFPHLFPHLLPHPLPGRDQFFKAAYLHLLSAIEFPLNLDSELQKFVLLNFKYTKIYDFIDLYIKKIDETNIPPILHSFCQATTTNERAFELLSLMRELVFRELVTLPEILCDLILQHPDSIIVEYTLNRLISCEIEPFLLHIIGSSLTSDKKKQIAERIVCDKINFPRLRSTSDLLITYFNNNFKSKQKLLDNLPSEHLIATFLIFENNPPNNILNLAINILDSDLSRKFKKCYLSKLITINDGIFANLLKNKPEKLLSCLSTDGALEEIDKYHENYKSELQHAAKKFITDNPNIEKYKKPLLKCILGDWNKIFRYLIPHYGYIKDETFSLIPQNPKVSLFLYLALQKDPDSNEGLFDSITFKQIMAEFTWKENLLLVHTLLQKPELLKTFCDNYLSDSELNIVPHGYARHQYAELSYFLLQSLTKLKKRESHERKSNTPSLKKRIKVADKEWLLPKFVSSLGKNVLGGLPSIVLNRTLFFKNEDGRYDAYKFQKKGERSNSIFREYKITKLISKERNVFSPPDPVEVLALKSIPEEIQSHMKGVSLPGKITLVYHYALDNSNYMTYLNDPSLPEKVFNKARKAFLQKSAHLIKNGCLLPVADMYHNITQDRAYHPLANLLFLFEDRNTKGAGRIDQVMKAVAYPNVRQSGLADFGDIVTEGDYPVDQHMRRMPYRKHYIRLHERAKIILADMLFLATRWKKQGLINWKDKKTLKKFAELLKNGHKEFLTAYTEDEELSQSIVESEVYDWMSMAKQIHFWFQNDQDGYPPYLDREELPEDLYGDKVRVSLKIKDAKNYVPGKGLQSDGDLDLGCYNGPLALLEFEKMMNLSTLFVYVDELHTKYKTECKEKQDFESSFNQQPVNNLDITLDS